MTEYTVPAPVGGLRQPDVEAEFEAAVKTHVGGIFVKLGLRDRDRGGVLPRADEVPRRSDSG